MGKNTDRFEVYMASAASALVHAVPPLRWPDRHITRLTGPNDLTLRWKKLQQAFPKGLLEIPGYEEAKAFDPDTWGLGVVAVNGGTLAERLAMIREREPDVDVGIVHRLGAYGLVGTLRIRRGEHNEFSFLQPVDGHPGMMGTVVRVGEEPWEGAIGVAQHGELITPVHTTFIGMVPQVPEGLHRI